MVLFSLPLFMESCNDRLLHASFVEPLKSEVKRKISVCLLPIGQRHDDGIQKTAHGANFIVSLSMKPLNRSCHACAIIPGRKLFRHAANKPKAQPKIAIANIDFQP